MYSKMQNLHAIATAKCVKARCRESAVAGEEKKLGHAAPGCGPVLGA